LDAQNGLTFTGMLIPTHSGQVFRFDAGHRSELKAATIPR
jgi:hypothetical protein